MILIDKERCVGCGLCAADCITVNLQLVNGKAEVKGGCLECGHCVAICPQNAVSIPEFDMADVSACRMELDADVLLQAIKGRRSIRNYQAKKVEKEKLHLLAEAGRYTATAKNTQGCRFVLVQDELDTFKDMIWQQIGQTVETGILPEGVPTVMLGNYQRFLKMREHGADFLPFTFWTDLGYKELPSVKITEGSILTEHNRSINWNFLKHFYLIYLQNVFYPFQGYFYYIICFRGIRY